MSGISSNYAFPLYMDCNNCDIFNPSENYQLDLAVKNYNIKYA